MARGRRTLEALLAVAAAGVLVTLAILAWFAGVGRPTDQRPIVDGVPPVERKELLDRAAERTRSARDTARRELEQVEKGR
jgi:hypothetical protein